MNRRPARLLFLILSVVAFLIACIAAFGDEFSGNVAGWVALGGLFYVTAEIVAET